MLMPRAFRSLAGGILLTTLLCVSPTGTAQAAGDLLTTEAGHDVSTAFLLELANPLRTLATYRVGIVYADSGVGLLITPKGNQPVVEYIAGAGQDDKFWRRQLVDAAIEQVRNPQTSEFHFHVIRKILTADNCPHLNDAVAAFYSTLDATLSVPIDLAKRPDLPRAIVSDAGDYRIQIAHDGALLSLSRLGETGHPLARMEKPLWPVVNECINSVPSSADQEYTYSYRQALPGARTRGLESLSNKP